RLLQGEPVPWRDVTAWSGRTLAPTSFFFDIAARDGGERWPGYRADVGELEPGTCSALASVLRTHSTTGGCWVCLWSGGGGGALGAVRPAPGRHPAADPVGGPTLRPAVRPDRRRGHTRGRPEPPVPLPQLLVARGPVMVRLDRDRRDVHVRRWLAGADR